MKKLFVLLTLCLTGCFVQQPPAPVPPPVPPQQINVQVGRPARPPIIVERNVIVAPPPVIVARPRMGIDVDVRVAPRPAPHAPPHAPPHK